jgi:hypothetical protein
MRAVIPPDAGPYPYAGTGYSDPDAVTQIANGLCRCQHDQLDFSLKVPTSTTLRGWWITRSTWLPDVVADVEHQAVPIRGSLQFCFHERANAGHADRR